MPTRYRKFLLLISFLFFHGGSFSQSASATNRAPRVAYSTPENADGRRTNFEIIGKVESNYLVYKDNRSEDAISVYDNEMHLKKRVPLPFTTSNQLINVDFVAYPHFFYLFYQYQKKNVVHSMVAKLNADAQPLADPIELDTTHIGWAANNKIYTTLASDDKQHIILFKINSKNTKLFYVSTQLFNNDLLLERKSISMSLNMEERNDYFTDFCLTNQGDFVFGKCLRQTGSDYTYKVYMVAKYKEADTLSVQQLTTNDLLLDEVKLKVNNNNNQLLINAFYYKQKRSNIDGLYTAKWDNTTHAKLAENTQVFTDDLRAVAKNKDGNSRVAFNDYFIKNVLVRKDGGYVLISEAQYHTSRGGVFNRSDYFTWGNPWLSPLDYYYAPFGSWYNATNRWGANNLTRYHAENIMILSYNKEGALEWSSVIPKTQYDDESDNMISYQIVNTGQAVHFLFNQYERRQLLLNSQSIGVEGKVTRNPTIKNLDKGFDFMAKHGKQVSANEIIIPCFYRNYLCFAKIDL
jgi:hypothetical protein